VKAAELPETSPHFRAYADALRASATLGPVADLACGRGRHAAAAAGWGLPVIAVDRNPDFLGELQARSRETGWPLECLRADLEGPGSLPLRPGSCGAVLVFRFLYRPLAPLIEELLAPGGLLLYETFTRAGAERGRGPRNPDFWLAPGELVELFPRLQTLSWQEDDGEGSARLAARKPS